MRILFPCWLDPATTDYPLFMARAWENEGHEVRLFPYDLEFSNLEKSCWTYSSALSEPVTRSLLIEKKIGAECLSFDPHVILQGGMFLTPEGISRLRSRHNCLMGSIIGYNHILEGRAAEVLSSSDFIISHDSYLEPILRGHRYGKVPHVFFMPCMADPQEHHPINLNSVDLERYGADVAFIGGAGANRIEALNRLKSTDLRIWGGAEWGRVPDFADCFSDEPVYGHKKTKIYNAASIVLNIEDDEKQINAVSNRVPEVLACGGFVITDWRNDLGKTELIDGESVVTYRSLDELHEKVMYYLEHPEERSRISERGRKIVLNSLTYEHGAAPIIRKIDEIVQL